MAAQKLHHLDTQVVVVGAGPVGLMLAGELRLGGADVIVLEQLGAPTTESRASTLHARTMEILDSRGLLDTIGTPPNEPRGHFGGIPLDLTLPGPYPGQWKVPQTRAEEVLQDRAVSLGADIRRGHELRELSVRDDHIEAEVTGPGGAVRLRALYVVGCDGENSTVRALTGGGFPGEDAGREMLRADVAGINIPARRFERLEKGLAIAARRDGVTRVMVHAFGTTAEPRTGEPAFTEIAAVWKRVTGEDISGGTPLWVNSFGDANRQLDRYRDGRVLFAGDAAHQQMPIGGQALNLGLQDAVNLGWKLALQVDRKAPEGLLDSYHTERHAVGQRVLANIKAQAMLLLGGPEVEPIRAVFAELLTDEDVRGHLAGTISGLDIRYDVGADGHTLAGARLPHTELLTGNGPDTTTALLRSGRGLLLDLSGDQDGGAPARATAAPWADRVTTVTATAPAGSPFAAGDCVLVRPDGHVVRAGRGTEGLEAALRRWFGPPAVATAPAGKRRDGLTGKAALVTGSSRGIGRAAALRLAQEGALVAVHDDSDRDAADDVVTAIEKGGGRAFAIQAGLGAPGGIDELFRGLEQGLKERTGTTELNILVNNAGATGNVPPDETMPEMFDRMFTVNARAPFFIVRRVLELMPRGSRIINVSSGLTRRATPDAVAHAMSRGALEQLALYFARHLGPRGITVNNVAPGAVRDDSPLFGLPGTEEQLVRLPAFGRIGGPVDVADAVAFLASDDARWITGSSLGAPSGVPLG